MRIEKYGINLVRLREEDIEMVRNYRNQPNINYFMEYKKHISAEMQRTWFKSINNKENYFFIIEYLGEKIGLISTFGLKTIEEKRNGQCGIFVWREELWGSDVPVMAVLNLLDFTFGGLSLSYTWVKIMNHNKKALAFNKGLGYKLMEVDAGEDFNFYQLTRDNYYKRSEKIRKVAARIHGKSSKIIFEKGDSNDLILERRDLFEIVDSRKRENLEN